MGEAALTGVPVVCTDVGASFRVVTDPVTWEKFSAVVAPNDALSLARAQVNIMGLLELPVEIITDIVYRLAEKDVNSVCQTNKDLYRVFDDYLYRSNISSKYCGGFYRSIIMKNERSVRKFLRMGACPNGLLLCRMLMKFEFELDNMLLTFS